MKAGDKVIINPYVPNETFSKYGYGFHEYMRKPGVFTLEDTYTGVGFCIGEYVYDEEWLLPVPLFKVGDFVKIKEDLSTRDKVPYTITLEMEEIAGVTCRVEKVVCPARDVSGPSAILGDDGCKYILAGNAWNWSSPMFDLSNYKFKTKNNESRLQKQESSLRRDSGEIKCGICCRKHKPRVTVQPISYKEIFGRG